MFQIYVMPKILLNNKEFNGEILNVGSNKYISIDELYNKISKILGINKHYIVKSESGKVKVKPKIM